jgi:outer membrane autotransporter protein
VRSHGLLFAAACLVALSLPTSSARAVCNPPGGSNVTVTCSGTTTNQGPGANTGYGDSTQNGLNLTVQSGASVIGTSVGIDVNSNNTITNAGTITTNGTVFGNVFGISSNGPLTVINSGTIGRVDLIIPSNTDTSGINTFGTNLSVTNTSTGVIQGSLAIQAAGSPSVMTVVNSGLISGIVGGGGIGIFGDTVNVTNNASGTITADAVAINANTATIFNYGTISAPVVGGGGTAINGTISVTVTNFASGIISSDGSAITAPIVTVTNFGTISGTGLGGAGIAGGTVTVMNSGTIQGTAAPGIQAGPNSSITNLASGVIAGAPGISASGPTSIFNAGTITGLGGNAIQFFVSGGNTLTIAPTSVINGNVSATGNDTFQLGGSGAATFDLGLIGAAAQYQGFGIFNKVGDSTWTLVGSGNQSWTVQSGKLIVDGTDTGAFTVGAGAILGGSGTIGALTVQSGGTVAPGNSIGTLNVASVSFGAGSIYQVEANAAGQSDKIVASGKATLSGGTVQVLAAAGNFAPSTTYTILTAQGGVTGTFAGVTSNLAFLIPTLSYDANDAFLTLTRNATLFQSVAATPNQLSVAGALDRFPTDNPLFLAVLNQSAAGARQAFDALSGEIHASLETSLIDDSRFMRQAMLGRLRQAAYSGAPGTLAALGFDGPQLAYREREPGYAAAVPFPVKAAPAPPVAAPVPELAYWAQAVGAWGSFDSDSNAAALNRNLAGFFTGFDARFGEAMRAGLAAGYTRSSISVDARASSAGIDTAHLGIYGGTGIGALSLRSGAAFAWHTIDTSRSIVFPGFFDSATAHYNGGTGQIFGEAGYGMTFGPVAVEPFAGATLVHVKTDGFAEAGGPAALTGAGNEDTMGYSTFGARFASVFALPNGMALIPRATLAWQHAFGQLDPRAALAFESTAIGFGILGVPLARDSALVEGGLDLRINPQAKLGLWYSGELAKTARDHAVKGSFTWNF